MKHPGESERVVVQPVPLSGAYLHGLVEAVQSVRPGQVSGEEVVVVLGQVRSLLNWAGAREMALTAELAGMPLLSPPIPDPREPEGFRRVLIETGVEVAVGEVAAGQCLSVLSARRRVEQAVTVTRDLPATFAAMSTGLLDGYRAKIMVEELVEAATESGESVVPADVRAEIEGAVIPRAHELTPSQLRARLRREIARRCTGKRAIRARAGLRARVECGPLPGGMGYLHAILPADAVALAEVTLESMARVLHAAAANHQFDGQALPVPPFARRDNQSDASWRAEHRQWARAEALGALFRSLADGRPLPLVTPSPPATSRSHDAPDTPTPRGASPAGASPAGASPAGGSAAGVDTDSAQPTDWPFTTGGLDFTLHEDGHADAPGQQRQVVGWWLPPLLPTRQGRVPHLNLTVSLATLRGTSDEPAELDGYGPIPADLARQLADQLKALYDTATFSLIGLDEHGNCVHVGTRTPYRPSQSLRDKVTAIHPHCRAPGCRRPAAHCDLDHRVPHANGGPTCEHNLDPLCRFHHRLKTLAGWTVRQAPPQAGRPPGTLEWITTYGTHRYTEPEPWPDPHETLPASDDSPEPPF